MKLFLTGIIRFTQLNFSSKKTLRRYKLKKHPTDKEYWKSMIIFIVLIFAVSVFEHLTAGFFGNWVHFFSIIPGICAALVLRKYEVSRDTFITMPILGAIIIISTFLIEI
jgi:hypothetical protein